MKNLLLEQDWSKTRVERSKTFILHDLGEAANKSTGIRGLRDETDTGGLQRTESNISEELGKSGGSEIDCCSVLLGGFISEEVDSLSLEKFVSSELEGALEEVSSSRRSEARQESSRSFLSYDLSETSNHAFVVGERVELHPGLDAVFRRGLVSKLHCRYVQNLLVLAHRRRPYPRLVYKTDRRKFGRLHLGLTHQLE
jgi:hypothetical protein